MRLIKHQETPQRDFGNGLQLKILLDRVSGAIGLDVGTVKIPAGGQTAMHARNFEEVIYMLSGQGQVITDDGEVFELNTGDCILIPAGVNHYHKNDSETPLEQMYIFAPQANDKIQTALRELPIIKEL